MWLKYPKKKLVQISPKIRRLILKTNKNRIPLVPPARIKTTSQYEFAGINHSIKMYLVDFTPCVFYGRRQLLHCVKLYAFACWVRHSRSSVLCSEENPAQIMTFNTPRLTPRKSEVTYWDHMPINLKLWIKTDSKHYASTSSKLIANIPHYLYGFATLRNKLSSENKITTWWVLKILRILKIYKAIYFELRTFTPLYKVVNLIKELRHGNSRVYWISITG